MVNSMITNSRLNFKFSCYEEVRQRSLKGKMVGTVEHMKGRNIYVLSDVTIQNVYEFNDRVVNEFRRSRRSEQILQQNSCYTNYSLLSKCNKFFCFYYHYAYDRIDVCQECVLNAPLALLAEHFVFISKLKDKDETICII